MNAQDLVARAQKWSKEQPWRLFGSQISILVRNEVRRNLFTRRRIWIYLLALIPALIILTHLIVGRYNVDVAQMEIDTQVLAGIVQLYYFRLGIFFACMAIFTWLFRGEMVERTLHYQFLVPVRKEVLVVGKFLAGAVISVALFETAVFACFYLTYSRLGSTGRSYVLDRKRVEFDMIAASCCSHSSNSRKQTKGGSSLRFSTEQQLPTEPTRVLPKIRYSTWASKTAV